MVAHYLEAASTYAADIDGIISLITLLVGFWFIVAEVVLIGLVVAFRRREGKKSAYITGETKSQMRWIAVPLVLIIACDVWIAVADGAVWTRIKQDLPAADATVRVIGQQWAWTFVHPGPDGLLDTADDDPIIGELHVEVGKVYHYKLESRDVLHSFSVPVFRLKQDAIPGRIITGWFEATIPGSYDIQCAEICGVGHGYMPAKIVIETPEQHAAWLASRSPVSLAANDTLPSVEE